MNMNMNLLVLTFALVVSGHVLATDNDKSRSDVSQEYVLKNPNNHPEGDRRKIRAENLRKIREHKRAVAAAKEAGKESEIPALVWE